MFVNAPALDVHLDPTFAADLQAAIVARANGLVLVYGGELNMALFSIRHYLPKFAGTLRNTGDSVISISHDVDSAVLSEALTHVEPGSVVFMDEIRDTKAEHTLWIVHECVQRGATVIAPIHGISSASARARFEYLARVYPPAKDLLKTLVAYRARHHVSSQDHL